MGSRRPLLSGVTAALALLPALLWLGPALTRRLAPSFRDQADFFYPIKLHTADRLRAGEIPLWNPLSGTGEPWLANLQSGVFYPPALLFWLPSPALAAALYLLFHFAVGIWGMRRFLRQEAVSETGALLSAIIFANCGFAASLSTYWNHFGAWTYLPGIAALARSGLHRRATRLGLAMLIGLQAMTGSPEICAMTAALAVPLALSAKGDPERPWLEDPAGRRLLRFGGALVLGLALAACVLLPFAELVFASDRRGPLPVWDRESGALPAGALVSAAGLAEGTAGPYLASTYLGPAALLAAGAAFREKERRGLALLLAGAAAAGILLAAEGAPGSWVRALPPLDRIRYPAKWLAVTVFGIAALAGLGADSLRFVIARGRARFVFCAAAAVALAAALAAALAPATRAAAAAAVLALLMLLFVTGRKSAAGAALQAVAAVALVVSYGTALSKLFRFAPQGEIRRRPEAVASLSRVSGRVLTPPMGELAHWAVRDADYAPETLRRQREALLGYTNLLSGVSTVRTAAALPTLGAAWIASAIDGAADPVRAAGPANARVLWTPFRPADLPSRRVEEFFRAPLAPYRPRLSFLRGWRVEPDPGKAWRTVSSGQVDLAREVLLERPPPLNAPQEGAGPLLIASLAEDRPERVVAEVTTSFPGILLLTDLHYPGWRAQANGRDIEILRADGLFRAVALPAGAHRVVFRYRPISFYAGAALSISALLTILLLFHAGEPVEAGRLR